MNNLRKEEKGITLIALVVTIAVLLILAVVSISMLTGENGIITQAQRSKEETRGGTVEEARDLWVSEKKVDNELGTNNAERLTELLNKLYEEGNLTEAEIDGILYGTGYVTIGSHFIDFRINGEIDLDGVARIEKVLYATLQEAFNAVPADGTETTVVLLKNISENVLVETNKNIILNLGECTITNIEGTAVGGEWNQAVFEVYGELELQGGNIVADYGNAIEVYDGTLDISGEAEIVGRGDGYPTISNEGDGIVNISGGKITAETSNAIYNYSGTVNIEGGTITANGSSPSVYAKDGVINITGGNIYTNSSWCCVYVNNCTWGANVSGNAVIYNDSTLEDACGIYYDYYTYSSISGGSISSKCGSAIFIDYCAVLTITGGDISVQGEATAIWNDKCANLIINGGNISAENGYALYTPHQYGGYSTEIQGGNFTNNSNACATIYGYGVMLTISAGNITNNGGYYGLELAIVPETEDEMKENEVVISENAVISSKNF